MALKPLNSVGGFSVGEIPANVILSNADFVSNNLTVQKVANLGPIGNVKITGGTSGQVILTDGLGNLSFATIDTSIISNGNSNVSIPAAGGNVNISAAGNANILVVTGVGANVTGNLGVSGSLTVNLELAGNTANFSGNAVFNGANVTVGNALLGNTANFSGNVVAPNLSVNLELAGNTANFSGNIKTLNANLGNLVTANFANFANDLVVQGNIANANNISVTNNVNAVIGNFSGNITSLNANLGNLATANYVNVAQEVNGNVANFSGNLTALNANLGNLAIANYVNVANQINGNIANFSGNLTALNADLGNLATANYVNVAQQVNGNVANFSGNLTAQNANLGNLANVNFLNVANTLTVSLELQANTANFDGNVVMDSWLAVSNTANVGNLRTDNLLYANGQPWDLQEAAGSNFEIQYNINDNFAASANFTYNDTTQVLTVAGNANVTNTLLTPNVNSGSGNLTLTSNGKSTVYDNSGNVTFPAGGTVTAGTFVGNVQANITITAPNTTILFSDNGLVDGSNAFTFNKTSNLVTMSGNLRLGPAGYNNINNNSNAALEIQGGWNQASGSGVNIVAGDYNNNSNWGKLSIQGNVSGNAVGYAEANAFVFTNPGSGLGNVVKVDILNPTATSTTTGVIQANGGIGVTGNGYFGGNLVVTGDIANANNISVSNSLNAVTGNFSGNINSLNANLGNLAIVNFANVSNTITTSNLTVNLALAGNTANFSGNVVAPNLTVNNNIAGNTANFSGNVVVPNLAVNLALAGNTANFSGNVVVPNLAVNLELAGNTANFTGNISAANANLGNLATANFVNVASNLVSNNISVNLELAGNTANFIGNVTLSGPNVTVNNYLSGNIANFSGNITSLNANLGNIADANYIRTQQLYNGSANIDIINNGNIAFSPNLANVMVLSNVGANIIGYVTANGDGSFGAVKSNSVTAQGGNLGLYSFQTGDTYIELRPHGNGTVDVGNTRITSLATPTAGSDAATKQYVDDVVQGLNIHDSAYAATANTLANLTGGTITYNNGTAGVGANLVLSGSPTLNYLSANVFDGNTQAVVGSRILVKNEANAAHNGVYVVDSTTVLTRASDYNSVPEVEAGDFIFVQDGTTYNDTGWVQTSVVTTIGTDPINFTQFSGAGTYQAGAGLTLTGTVFSVNVDNVTTEISGGNVIVKANAQLTTPNIGAATGTSLNLTGNLLAGNVNSNAKVTAVDIEASGNIVGNSISSNGNLTVANLTVNNSITGNTANFSGNVVAPNLTVNLALTGNTANFSGNVVVPNLAVNLELAGNTANFTGNITAANANLGNLVQANFVNVASNVTTSNLTVNLALAGNTANFSGNAVFNGANVTVGNALLGNTANFSGNILVNNATVNLELAGNTANFSGNVVVGNLSTSGSGGNITGANVVIANTFQGNLSATTANISSNLVTSNATVNLELAGNTANFSGNVIVANFVANGTANVGNLHVNANVLTSLLPNANLTIDLGSASQRWANVYAGNIDASGNLSIAGNLQSNNYTANIITANTQVNVGNTQVRWAEVVTSAITSNQTISTATVSGITGIEWIVKGLDSSGSKYSMAIVTAVTDGSNVDYSVFGGVNLGTSTGTLAVNISGSNIALQVTPSSSNNTTWVTQYRTI